MAWTTVRISGVDIQRARDSIQISKSLEYRYTASFTVVDRLGTANYYRGQPVTIFSDLAIPPWIKTQFVGYIYRIRRTRLAPNDVTIYHEVDCVGFHYCAEKRLAAESYSISTFNTTVLQESPIDILGPVSDGTITSPNDRGAQTFTPTRRHSITKVILTMCRSDASGTVTAGIYATDALGKPTGAALCSGTTNGATLPLIPTPFGEARTITMTTEAVLESGTQYAIVVSVDANSVIWRYNTWDAGSNYPKGQLLTSADAGVTWTAQPTQDYIFAEYGRQLTAGDIVEDLYTKYLLPEGVTIGTIEDGVDIREMVVNYKPVSDAFDLMAEKSGYVWYIDDAKRLFFTTRLTTAAPFAIVASDFCSDSGRSELAEDNPQYRNRQFLRGGVNVVPNQVETFTGDGAIVAYACGYSMNAEPVVTVGGAAQAPGIKGIDSAKDFYWAKGDPIIVFDATAIPPLGNAIVVTYTGEYPILVQVDNVAEQLVIKGIEGGTGITEGIDNAPEVATVAAAFTRAQEKLTYFGVDGYQLTFTISKWGLLPGQFVTITYPKYGLAASVLLVQSVGISEYAPGELRYTIQAIQGPAVGDWTNFFKNMVDKSDERIVIGDDIVLMILTSVAEGVNISELVTETVYTCFICDPLTLCSPATIVC